MPIDRGNVRNLVRAIAYDARGSRLGRVAQVFIDDRTDEPAWVAVDVTRTRGMRLLPLAGAALKGRHLVIRAERSTVRSAPRIDLGDGQLSSQDESRLLEHYGLWPVGDGAVPQLPDQRPASPWPDDTERETAWERPAQPSHFGDDTQAMSPSWQRPAPGEIGDRGMIRDHGSAAPDPGPGAAPALTRDTAPTPVTPAPSPPLGAAAQAPSPAAQPSTTAPPTGTAEPTAVRPDPDSRGSSPAPQTR